MCKTTGLQVVSWLHCCMNWMTTMSSEGDVTPTLDPVLGPGHSIELVAVQAARATELAFCGCAHLCVTVRHLVRV